MGYELYIGEGIIEDYGAGSPLSVFVDALELPEAPRFAHEFSYSSGTNHRHPSYTSWREFTRFVNLEEMFYDKKTGLLAAHPGASRITTEHLATVRSALNDLKQLYPDAQPRFSPPPDFSEDAQPAEEVPYADACLALLTWLEWWMAYALKHCQIPTFHNR